ncbi:TPA: porin [Pluralibacter gergoviae]|nr:porin [Pluralibacter gergoviae]HDS1243806.1 porin [Pluralibacter gergoviae]HDS1248282.1 porin [Pluralibacter gergoviae]HDS1253737.1 porin [Pluralibacter gergoviae]HDS1260844.1 porin [Pluralibacter gergoviae]
MLRRIRYYSALVLFSSVSTFSTHAEVTVLEKKQFNNTLLDPLSLEVGGSIRPEFIWNNGPEPGYDKNGHDGGTRFRFTADYALAPHTSVVGYYEWGVDIAHVLGMSSHYDHDAPDDFQRQLYGGIKDDRYGTLTYGHQYGAYYDAVGVKSDVWDNDGHASANWIGVGGDYDGGERPKNTLKYTNTFGDLTLYADYLMPVDEKWMGDDMRYRRNHGGGIGFDYQLEKDLTVSAAWNQTKATIKNSAGEQKGYHQQYSGAALTWQPDNWYLVGTATWYKHYVPTKRTATVDRYFAGDGYGLESFAGYTFHIDKPLLQSVQPYLGADTLRLKGEENYHANHVYLGMYTQIAYGFSFYLERTLASTSDNEAHTTWLSVYYDF